ncbi:MAG: hypothetical protein ABI548_04155 [Polyangiaceae bacterium]
MFQNGYWVVGRLRGATIRLHWSILVCAVVLSRFSFRPGFFVAYPCLILIHEFGHAFFVWRRGHAVVNVEASGFGGQRLFDKVPPITHMSKTGLWQRRRSSSTARRVRTVAGQPILMCVI